MTSSTSTNIALSTGDLFASRAQTWVNTVNCVGVMGKGIALEFKRQFSDMFDDYTARCARQEVRLGEPYLYRRLTGPWILNFPTKDHWRSPARLDDIVRGLDYLAAHCGEWGIESLAVPPLGCGHGGLEWRIVGPTLYRHLRKLGIPVELFPPREAPEAQKTLEFVASGNGSDAQKVRVPAAWVALVTIVERLLAEPYHWPIGRTIFQKIAYFATEAGLPTEFQFQRASYGPFSPDLKQAMSVLQNHGLLEESQLGRMLAVRPGRTLADAKREFASELEGWEPIIDRVTDLFLRVDTSQAEIGATVHFAATHLLPNGRARSEDEVFRVVAEWKRNRRPPLADDSVGREIRNLNLLGWVQLAPSQALAGVESVEA